MAVENIFTKVIFTDYILPWILVFVLIFAILEKSQLLGEGKRQINAILSAVVGLILLAVPYSRDIINQIVPFMVILAVILFVFLLLYGFVSGQKADKDLLGKGVKIGLGIAIGIAILIAVLVITDYWNDVIDYLGSSNTGANIIFIIIAAAAVVAVLAGKGKE